MLKGISVILNKEMGYLGVCKKYTVPRSILCDYVLQH
jgi:hypothetical protein